MPSKKELLKRIEDLEERLTRLENMHARITHKKNWAVAGMVSTGTEWEDDNGNIATYYGRQLRYGEILTAKSHPLPRSIPYRLIEDAPKPCAKTEAIGKISLEELARLVVDGTPIERTERFEGQMGVKYDRTRKVESVDTPLGTITATTIKKE